MRNKHNGNFIALPHSLNGDRRHECLRLVLGVHFIYKYVTFVERNPQIKDES
jgi:hypothetical protein